MDRLNYGMRQFGNDDIELLVIIVGTRTEQQIRDVSDNTNAGRSSCKICLGKDDNNDTYSNSTNDTATESITGVQ